MLLRRPKASFAALLSAALPLFSVSQKALIPLLTILGCLALFNKRTGTDPSDSKAELVTHWAWLVPGLAYTALASRNALNDINTGLISGEAELIASLSRSSLYIIAPLILYLTNRSHLIRLTTLCQSLIAGLQAKILLCLTLTLVLTGVAAKKSYILQFPTLEPYVTTWVGPYFLISTGIVCLLIHQKEQSQKECAINLLLILASVLLAFYCAVALNNLTCTISGFSLVALLIIQSQKFLVPSLYGAREWIKISTNKLLFAFFLATFMASIISLSNLEHIQSISQSLRINHLWARNDRLELFGQGIKRFTTEELNIEYLTTGPSTFQRPICFKASEAIFLDTSTCHQYWHSIPWDSFRNFGYIGFALGLSVTLSLTFFTWRFTRNKAPLPAIATLCCFFIILTTPTVEVGAGEIIPLMLLITLLSSAL